MSEQNTLRDMLESNLTASAEGTLNTVADAPVIETTEVEQTDRSRDEQGRFAAKEKAAAEEALVTEAAPVESAIVDPVVPVVPVNRPTTWKKEYLPIWDKIAVGAPLTVEESKKLADYSQQREKEYATGVSTYRAEATAANELKAAVEPFMPAIQQNGMKVGDWISNLGKAHQTLVYGSPDQKMQMFATMARQYGIPLEAIAQGSQGQLDPIVSQLMQQVQDLKSQFSTKIEPLTSWREQQESNALKTELAKFEDTSKYPHFEQVRGDMAQILESGMAQDLDGAYAKAVRLNEDAWSAEQARQAQHSQAATQIADKAAAAVKAKAAAVSVKSTSPSGTTKTNAGGLREQLEAGFDSMASGRL